MRPTLETKLGVRLLTYFLFLLLGATIPVASVGLAKELFESLVRLGGASGS